MIDATFDLIGALLMLVGAGLCFAAAVALVRFPDVMSKMHAVTETRWTFSTTDKNWLGSQLDGWLPFR